MPAADSAGDDVMTTSLFKGAEQSNLQDSVCFRRIHTAPPTTGTSQRWESLVNVCRLTVSVSPFLPDSPINHLIINEVLTINCEVGMCPRHKRAGSPEVDRRGLSGHTRNRRGHLRAGEHSRPEREGRSEAATHRSEGCRERPVKYLIVSRCAET